MSASSGRRTSADMEVSRSPVQNPARASFPPRRQVEAGAAMRARVLRQSVAGTDADVTMIENDTPHSAVPMSTGYGDDGKKVTSTGGTTVLGKRPYLNTEDRAYLRMRKQEMDDVINEEPGEEEEMQTPAGQKLNLECPDLT